MHSHNTTVPHGAIENLPPEGVKKYARARHSHGKWGLAVPLLALVLAACQTVPQAPDVADTPIDNARQEVPENELLDVGIHVLESGPISEDDREKGINEDIRNAEARFIAIHLRETIQHTGHWGAVRVVPGQTEAAEVIVAGQIEKSNGESLVLKIDAYDASGARWFSQTYEKNVPQSAYGGAREGEVFQDVYNRIANDLYREKSTLSVDKIEQIRRVARLRFARSLAPDAFSEHLKKENGAYQIQRLPAKDDPMMERVLSIREREYLMVDVINGYYDNLYSEMTSPYFDWRRLSAEEAAALREVKRKSTQRYLLGSALIIGAIAVEVLGGNTNTGTLRDVMVIGGAASVKGGMDLGAQKRMHKDAIRELGESFQAEVAPLVVDIEGQTTELTGSAEEQFIQWRALLREIYQTETGLPVPSIRSDGEVESANESPVPATGTRDVPKIQDPVPDTTEDIL